MIRTILILALVAGSATAVAAEPEKQDSPTGSVQTLDSITIEGDVAVPQVLFITSREHPRHHEDLGRVLRLDALTLARRVSGPDRLVVIDDCISRTIKEQ